MLDLYKTSEWKSLDFYFRVDLIPMVEDIRSGALIELWRIKNKKHRLHQKQSLENWLLYSGLKYKSYKEGYYICKDDFLLNKLYLGVIKTGEFLGYPKCCIENFEESCQRYLSGQGGKGPAKEFWQSAKEAIDCGTFDDNLYYILHAPCSLNCKETFEMAKKIRNALELRDPKTVEYLKNFNLQNLKNFN